MPIADMDMLLLFHADMYLVVVVLLWLGKGLDLKQNPFGGIFSITNTGLIKEWGLNIYMVLFIMLAYMVCRWNRQVKKLYFLRNSLVPNFPFMN